jgi:hypothetical protein
MDVRADLSLSLSLYSRLLLRETETWTHLTCALRDVLENGWYK